MRAPLLLACLLVACQAPQQPGSPGAAGQGQPAGALAAGPGAPQPSAGQGLAWPDGPAPPPRPPLEVASPEPAGLTPDPLPAPAPPTSGRRRRGSVLSAADVALADRVSGKLVAIAAINFVSRRSAGDAQGSGPLSAGVITDRGAAIISNGGGALISDRSGGYRLAQALPEASDPVVVTPVGAELAVLDRHWTFDQRRVMYLQGGNGGLFARRELELQPADQVRAEFRQEVLEAWPSEQPKRATFVDRIFHDLEKPFWYMIYDATFNEAGEPLEIAVRATPPSTIRDPGTGVSVVVKAFAIDTATQGATVEYLYETFNATEAGTLVNVTPDETGVYRLRFDDPLGHYDGDTVLRNAANEVVFAKHQRTVAGVVSRTYDLQGGLTAELTRVSPATWTGELKEGGGRVAGLEMRVANDGSTVFRVAFPSAPDDPVELGYGAVTQAAPVPAPSPLPRPEVLTIAGDPEPGHVDGVATAARFDTLLAVERSLRDPGTYYLADAGNACIRKVVRAGDALTVSTLVGATGAAPVDGSLAQARFAGPSGLAVREAEGGGETLYVTDGPAGTLRAIALGAALGADGVGTVTTLADLGATAPGAVPVPLVHDPQGSRLLVAPPGLGQLLAVGLADATPSVTTLIGTTPGFADGGPGVGQLGHVTGLALGPGRELYLADFQNLRVRLLDLDDAVPSLSTLVGDGQAGRAFLDGPLSSAGVAPGGVLPAGDGRVLVLGVDVRVVDPLAQAVRTLAGSGLGQGYLDGPADQAEFFEVLDGAWLDDGSLWVVDGNRLRLLVPAVPGQPLVP